MGICPGIVGAGFDCLPVRCARSRFVLDGDACTVDARIARHLDPQHGAVLLRDPPVANPVLGVYRVHNDVAPKPHVVARHGTGGGVARVVQPR